MIITVVCKEEGLPNILLYTVDADPNDEEEVRRKVEEEREKDLGEACDIELFVAFNGDVAAIADWRD